MRVIVAALLGAIAMFAWTSVAHLLTPLGSTGFSRISNEAAVLQAVGNSIGAKPGLYFFPWIDPKDPDAMKKSAALEKVNPSGLLLYRPAGGGMDGNMAPMLLKEFVKQFIQALIAAYIVSRMVRVSFFTRFFSVMLIGLSAAIATNVSYWNWYGFPLDFTLAAIIVEIGSGIAAGLAIAWLLGRRSV